MMKANDRISDGLMENMRNWHHSGFSVHNEVVIQKEDREALVRLAQYVVHASFSSEKIRYVEKTGCVMYKSRLHQGKKRNFEVLDAIEFLHRVCLHIPGHYEALIRYYGHYANPAKLDKILGIQNRYSKSAYVLNKGSYAARGKRKKLGLEIERPLNIIDDAPNKKTCRRSWSKLIFLLCAMRSCMGDGGRPTGNGLQELLSNCPELYV